MDADYEVDRGIWCGMRCPDDRAWSCSRQRGHGPDHVAHSSYLSTVGKIGEWQRRWSDGDTVSVKAGAVATIGPASSALCGRACPDAVFLCQGAPWHRGACSHPMAKQKWTDAGWYVAPTWTATVPAPSSGSWAFEMCLGCNKTWNKGKASACVCKKADAETPEWFKPEPAPSRRDLAADLLPRVLELGSAFRGDRMLFMKWEEIIRVLKKEAKP